MRGPAGLATQLRYVSALDGPVATTLGEVDVERVACGLPVRRVRSYAGDQHYSGWFWSATTGGHVPYESRLELDRLWLADFAPDVEAIAAQPMWLCGRDGSQVRRHVPDLLLRQRDGSVVVVDVKPRALMDRPEVAAVLRWTGQLCQSAGWSYEVWSGADPVRLANVRWLGQARRPGLVAPELRAAVLTAWRPGHTIGQLVSTMQPSRKYKGVLVAVLHALWCGLLRTDLSRPLDESSVLLEGVNRARSSAG